MHIKSLIIDGFKSYNKRTVVDDFDPYFNAVTGLNGSGKSNILDAICFVLGISNLSSVRANSLQELIYKNGQAGITKASVTIVFDNSVKSASPIGYEDFDEITISRHVAIGGRNKYLLNGCNCTNTRIHDLFCSIQLNVNNPHFLIMQGKITQVLNMKPGEILSMLEEAAGTKMYETKRISALKTLEKKDSRLNQINSLLENDINPIIENLKKDRRNYSDYQENCARLETMQHNFNVKTVASCKHSIFKLDAFVLDISQRIEQLKMSENECENLLAELKSELEAERLNAKNFGANSDKLRVLEGALANLNKSFIGVKSFCKKLVDDLETCKSVNDAFDENSLVEKINLNEKMIESKIEMSENMKKKMDSVKNQIKSLKNINIEDIPIERIKNLENNVAYLENFLNSKNAEYDNFVKLGHILEKISKNSFNFENFSEKQTKLIEQKTQISSSLVTVECFLDAHKNVDGEILKKNKNLRADTTELNSLKLKFPQYFFDSTNKVFVNLIKLKENFLDFSLCLEVAAGGKLFNIVVDSDNTAKNLLSKKDEHPVLKNHRVTFIALNKVQSKDIAKEQMNKLYAMAGGDQKQLSSILKLKGNVYAASDLIEYDEKIRNAVNFVFGATLVCEHSEDAKYLIYKKNIRLRCVTVDGDIFEPSGTLTGGSRKSFAKNASNVNVNVNNCSVFDRVLYINRLVGRIELLAKEVESLNRAKSEIEAKSREKEELLNKIENLNRMIEELDNQVRYASVDLNSVSFIVKDDKSFVTKMLGVSSLTFEQLNSQIKNYSDKKNTLKSVINEKNNQLSIEKDELSNFNVCSSEINSTEAKIEQLKKDLKKNENEYEKILTEKEQLKMENTRLANLIQAKKSELVLNKQKMDEISENLHLKNAEKQALEQEISSTEAQIDALSKLIEKSNQTLTDLTEKYNFQQSQLFNVKKELAEHTEQLAEANKKIYINNKKIEEITKTQHVGISKIDLSKVDFADLPELSKSINLAKEEIRKKSKTINIKAMELLQQAEKRYEELKLKKGVVEKDKLKIIKVIEELDEKKHSTLTAAWQKVNKDFAAIFSSLLPSCSVKLEPVDRRSVLSGLEIHVAFGKLWKESLSELSGGQRSLAALSLILSMLLFKPAPIYILDEVDAALDISHTQNIGIMLSQHFKASQFIIVSLKEGMFNNANVLYKTSFVSGSSLVTRHSQAFRS